MRAYYIEGVYRPKKARKGTGEPFARTIWADNSQEALRLATEALGGGQWLEGPVVSQSEEQRMRQQGAPELPGFDAPPKKKRSRS